MTDIHSSTLRDEVKELEYDMTIKELLDYITSDNTLIDINNVLEDIARDKIIMRSEDNE
tara:strand:- start:3566 stop:3742 length:177 start_codon:yes stop_codon:yes gene_type:complete